MKTIVNISISTSAALLALAASSLQATAANVSPPFTSYSVLGNGSVSSSAIQLTTGAVDTFSAESFLGLSSGSIQSLSPDFVTLGSVAQTTVTANAGDTFSFKWLFQAGDYLPYNDFAFYSVAPTSTLLSNVALVGDFGTGAGDEVYTFSAAGTYTVGFGVFNANDNSLDSQLTIGAIPEPLTMLGAAAAAGFGTAFKRKLAKKQNQDNSKA